MTDGEAITGSPETVVDTEKLERINALLEDAKTELFLWAANEDSDSVSIQRQRVIGYARACELLGTIWGDLARTDKEMSLSIPSEGEAFKSHRFGKNPYDFIYVEPGEDVEAGQSVLLKNKQVLSFVANGERASHWYFGSPACYFEVADIAKILASGGSLELADTIQPESA